MTEKSTTKGEAKTLETAGKSKAEEVKKGLAGFGEQVEKFASKTFESVKNTIDKALISRNTVLTIRVNDESNEKLSMLVETGLFKSRSESAAFLIDEGIKKQTPLFKKIEKKMAEIQKLKDELTGIISEEIKPET